MNLGLTTDEKNEKLRELETAKDEALERVNQANGEYEQFCKTDGISTVNSVSVQGTKNQMPRTESRCCVRQCSTC